MYIRLLANNKENYAFLSNSEELEGLVEQTQKEQEAVELEADNGSDGPNEPAKPAVGARVELYWATEGQWYSGCVAEYDQDDDTSIVILYDETETEDEIEHCHNISEITWRPIPEIDFSQSL